MIISEKRYHSHATIIFVINIIITTTTMIIVDKGMNQDSLQNYFSISRIFVNSVVSIPLVK